MESFYDMIFKRKSVRQYDASRRLTGEELADIQHALDHLQPLLDIPAAFRIVKRSETSCLWGEYCLMAYCEKQDGYLINIGYMLEQMDLFLASRDIGACWYGIGKPAEKEYEGKPFVIMMSLGKCKPEKFRQEMAGMRRKKITAICEGVEDAALLQAIHTAHYAPSACNSQPWYVVGEGTGQLKVCRSRGIQSRIAAGLIGYMNKIDLGIFLCFLELALQHEGVQFHRKLLKEDLKKEPIPVAVYQLGKAEE